MRLVSLAEIARARLVNSPSVDRVAKIVFDARRVKRGDCFVDTTGDFEAQKEAIANGAYAIIAQSFGETKDNEIGYIVSSDIAISVVGILRFLLLENSVSIYIADSFAVDIARSYIDDKQVFAARSNEDAIVTLQNSETKISVLISSETELSDIAKEAKPAGIKLLKKSLISPIFEIAGEAKTLAIPSIFIDQLSAIFAVARANGLKQKWHQNSPNFADFELISIDDKMIIFSSKCELISRLITDQMPWQRVAFEYESRAHIFSIDSTQKEQFLQELSRQKRETLSLFDV